MLCVRPHRQAAFPRLSQDTQPRRARSWARLTANARGPRRLGKALRGSLRPPVPPLLRREDTEEQRGVASQSQRDHPVGTQRATQSGPKDGGAFGSSRGSLPFQNPDTQQKSQVSGWLTNGRGPEAEVG